MKNPNEGRVEKITQILKSFTEIQYDKYGQPQNEAKVKIIKDYLEYVSMSLKDQDTLLKDWNDYFEKCRQSIPAKRWTAQGKAFKNKNYKLVIEFGKKAREQIENQDFSIPKPYLEDPLYLLNNTYTKTYTSLVHELEKLGDNSETIMRNLR